MKKVFISATGDLYNHIAAVIEAIHQLEEFAIVIGDADDAVVHIPGVNVGDMRECDVFIGILAYTIQPRILAEYEEATRLKIPRLFYLVYPDYRLPGVGVETNANIQAQLQHLENRAIADQTVRGLFTTPENLVYQVVGGLTKLLSVEQTRRQRSWRLIGFTLLVSILILAGAYFAPGWISNQAEIDTLTFTPSATGTLIPSDTLTFTPSATGTLIPSDTPTFTPSATDTLIPSDTPTFTPSATDTLIPSDTPTFTPSATGTLIPSDTPTFTPSATDTLIPSDTPTFTPSATETPSPGPTATEAVVWQLSHCVADLAIGPNPTDAPNPFVTNTPNTPNSITPAPTSLLLDGAAPFAPGETGLILADFWYGDTNIFIESLLEQTFSVANVPFIRAHYWFDDYEQVLAESALYNATILISGCYTEGHMIVNFDIVPRPEVRTTRVIDNWPILHHLDSFAVRLYPGMDSAVIGDIATGLSHYFEQNYTGATEAFDRAEAQIPYDMLGPTGMSALSFYRGNSHYQMGNYERALVSYERAVELNSNIAAFWHNACVTHRNVGEYDHSIIDCTQAIELPSMSPISYWARGRVFYELGNYDQAIADYLVYGELSGQFEPFMQEQFPELQAEDG
jgi:hypothetical protein